jgi:hypothetical protein
MPLSKDKSLAQEIRIPENLLISLQQLNKLQKPRIVRVAVKELILDPEFRKSGRKSSERKRLARGEAGRRRRPAGTRAGSGSGSGGISPRRRRRSASWLAAGSVG